ncbi:MAG: isoprenyl transferase [Paludibacter sp.]
MSSFKEKIDFQRLPRHVAIIMDGNGRWAKERGYDRIFGHQNGVVSVREVTEAAAEIGIGYLTLYAFSTENWGRPQAEVDALMELLIDTIEKETPTLNKNNVRLLAIGDLTRLPVNARIKLQTCIDQTSENTGLSLVLALSYSSRWEIRNAMQLIAQQVKDGILQPQDISDEMISGFLTTKSIPDPDLMIRTSGETRISNFLLWQMAYTELYFTSIHWPDFRKENFYEAICDYQGRDRRFGKTK